MYGLVNAAIQELVCSKFGADKWEAIKKKAGVDLQVFNRMQPYPEEMTYNLVGAVSEVLNIPADQPSLTYALARFGGLSGRQIIGQLPIGSRDARNVRANPSRKYFHFELLLSNLIGPSAN